MDYYLEQVAVTNYNGMQPVVYTVINVVTANAIGYSQANSVYLFLVARARLHLCITNYCVCIQLASTPAFS